LSLTRQANSDRAEISRKAANVFINMNAIINSKKLGVDDVKVFTN
jgi:hypothetical protein